MFSKIDLVTVSFNTVSLLYTERAEQKSCILSYTKLHVRQEIINILIYSLLFESKQMVLFNHSNSITS